MVNEAVSSVGSVTAGVLQVSVLGPLLLLLYINDITDNLGNIARIFADDHSLQYAGPDILALETQINDDLQTLNDWANQWLVDFNPEKTKALIISNTAYIDPVIKFNDEQVEIVECHKHLGVAFSSDGKWTNHINNIIESSMKQINALRKLKYILSSKNFVKYLSDFY
jgi:hypothetical protein